MALLRLPDNDIENGDLYTGPRLPDNDIENSDMNTGPRLPNNDIENSDLYTGPRLPDNDIENSDMNTGPRLPNNDIENGDMNTGPRLPNNDIENSDMNTGPRLPNNGIENSSMNTAPRLPGDIAMWLVIMMELTVFALFFIGFAVMKRLEPQMFAQGQGMIHIAIGLTCTLCLLMSSYLVALALQGAKIGNNTQVCRYLKGALFFAFIYLAAKSWEYAQLIDAGYDLSSNDFFTLYFLITVFHFMHVILGCAILFYMHQQASKQCYGPGEHQGFEAGAAYWHMVDLVWIMVFFLIYIAH